MKNKSSKKKREYHNYSKFAKNYLKISYLILGKEKKNLARSQKIHYLGYQPKEKTIPLIRGSEILIQIFEEGGINTTEERGL